MIKPTALLFICAWLPFLSHGAVLVEDESSVSLDFLTIFTDTANNLNVNLVWEDPSDFVTGDVLELSVSVNGEKSSIPIPITFESELPSTASITFETDKGGKANIDVDVLLSGESLGSIGTSIQAYGEGASLVPLIIVLILGFTTKMVELSLGVGIFIGACMISGNVQDGFTSTIENYILNSLAVRFLFFFLLVNAID